MEAEGYEIIKIALGSAGFLGTAIGIGVMIFKTGKIVQRIDTIEKKVDYGFKKVEERFEKVDERFQKMEEKFDKKFIELEEKMDSKFEKMEQKMDSRFRKLEDNLPTISIAIGKLEVRLEERTLRTLDLNKINSDTSKLLYGKLDKEDKI